MIAFAGLLTAGVLFQPTNIGAVTIGLSLVANTAGSMLPDIDQGSNKLWDLLPYGDLVGRYLSKIFMSHRSLSHSLLGLFLFGYVFHWLLPKTINGSLVNVSIVYASLMIGIVSHFLADGVTEEGLPLLFPLKYKFGFPPFKHLRMKTGHWFERYVVTLGILAFIIWLTANHYDTLLSVATTKRY